MLPLRKVMSVDRTFPSSPWELTTAGTTRSFNKRPTSILATTTRTKHSSAPPNTLRISTLTPAIVCHCWKSALLRRAPTRLARMLTVLATMISKDHFLKSLISTSMISASLAMIHIHRIPMLAICKAQLWWALLVLRALIPNVLMLRTRSLLVLETVITIPPTSSLISD